MLEKIGLPAKPSLRGNNWVVDASHCQGCSSQFTFINRKHHCRRCGGLFCNGCTLQRMALRGQGDSPVRICEPCKKLEEAARFELRHGHKSRTGRGSSKSISKHEDDVLAQILGSDRKESSSSVQESNAKITSTIIGRATSGVLSSDAQDFIDLDREGEACSSLSNQLANKMESDSPEELRKQALDEKKKYKVLKGEGKAEEALKAFKRGKELERKAESLEMLIRRSRRKSLLSGNAGENQEKGSSKESSRNTKLNTQMSKDKHDINAELRELGWSDMDLHDEDKKPATMSLEGELSSLLGRGVLPKTEKVKNVHSIDNTQVVVHKRKALMLKREGKLAEAKEELKKAKVLERQLEEQELLAGAEESDDELSALVRSLDDNKQEDVPFQFKENHEFDLNNLLGAANNFTFDSNFEVTDEDMEDPEIAAALDTLGWTEDSNVTENTVPGPSRESINSEIISLKREALNQKRAGNTAVAMEQLKKAKMLQRDLENFGSHEDSLISGGGNVEAIEVNNPKLPLKNKLTIQKELLAIKKRALLLRREGNLDEAEKELNKGKILEHQLEQVAATSGGNTTALGVGLGNKDLTRNIPDVGLVEDVTDQEMHDPEYLSVLKNLGWSDKDAELVPSKPSKQDDILPVHPNESSATYAPNYSVRPRRRSKVEVQRELLVLKRKALTFRRQGDTQAAEEVLLKTKALEAEMEEIENRDKVRTEFSRNQENDSKIPSGGVVEEGYDADVTEEDMNDPTLLSVLQNLGWNNEELEPGNNLVKEIKVSAQLTTDQSSSEVTAAALRSRSEIQREVLNLKRKALALRRKGEIDDAEEVLRRAKVLEIQMDELDAPKPTVVFNTEGDMSKTFRILKGDKMQGHVKDVGEVSKGSERISVNLKDEVKGLSSDLRISRDDSINSCSQNFDHSDRLNSKQSKFSLVEVGASNGNIDLDRGGAAETFSSMHQRNHIANTIDILTGNNWSTDIHTGEQNDLSISHSGVLSNDGTSIEYGSQTTSTVTNKDHFSFEKRENIVHTDGEQHDHEDSSIQESCSQSQSSLHPKILAHKKKAVALKREGKLSEAREELRQAKFLEKSLEENDGQPQLNSKDSSVSTAKVPSPDQKDYGSSTVEQKPMSSRERFKLQQESLKHKRQALKFRREGRIQEAELEFEKAKAIETRLEGLNDSIKSSIDGEEPAGDVNVEDFLDPQLISALKAIGLDDPSVSRGQEITKPPKVSTVKIENTDLERSQLEERIKAEKVKAVNLKRLGKQAEALEALRRAKLFEKKLNSIISD